MSRYQKGKTKTSLDFLEQETVSVSGISWAICKSARPRRALRRTKVSLPWSRWWRARRQGSREAASAGSSWLLMCLQRQPASPVISRSENTLIFRGHHHHLLGANDRLGQPLAYPTHPATHPDLSMGCRVITRAVSPARH